MEHTHRHRENRSSFKVKQQLSFMKERLTTLSLQQLLRPLLFSALLESDHCLSVCLCARKFYEIKECVASCALQYSSSAKLCLDSRCPEKILFDMIKNEFMTLNLKKSAGSCQGIKLVASCFFFLCFFFLWEKELSRTDLYITELLLLYHGIL